MGLSIRLLTFSRGYATRSGGSRIKPTLSLDQVQSTLSGRIQVSWCQSLIESYLVHPKRPSLGFLPHYPPRDQKDRWSYNKSRVSKIRPWRIWTASQRRRRCMFPHSLLNQFTNCSLQVTRSVSPFNWKDGVGRHGEVYRWYVAQQLWI